MKNLILIFTIIFFILINGKSQNNEARLMRFPSINKNQIVFTYAGDLYTVDYGGGISRKLTNHAGYEMFAKISPDGKYIAFTGQYDGNTEIYVMPANGGNPKRLTYTATLNRDDVADRMGPNNIVMAWSPDSKNIIYRSRRYAYNSFRGKLFSVSINGGISAEIPLTDGGFCSYSPNGKKLAFNWIFREFRTWKYYKGGMADDIRIYDFNTKKIEKITDNPAQDIFPMWHKNEIYFLSDRERTMNLFSYNINTKETKKVSDFKEFDIKFPSINDDKIIFENGGFLYVFDISTQKTNKISVQINDDFIYSRPVLKDLSKNINSVSISPTGKRLIISARGDIFSVPVKKGIVRNFTQSSEVHDRNPKWSPDGKFIAFISDKSGEFEIYIQKSDASKPAEKLTENAETYKYSIKWSPDSKKIIWSDKKLRLRYIDIKTKKITEIAKSKTWEYRNFNWSPDSKFIAYTSLAKNRMNKIIIYDLKSKKNHDLTDNWYSSASASFSNDGKYLFFKSAQSFNPIYNNVEWNIAYQNMNKIYFVLLSKDTKSPFAYENKEENNAKDENIADKKNDKDKKEKSEKNKKIDVKIDFDGLKNRIIQLPVKAGNYRNITEINGKIYYNVFISGQSDYKFMMYDLKKQKETKLGTNIGYSVSVDLKKMLIYNYKPKKFHLIDIPISKINLKNPLDVSGLKSFVDYKKEWKQIYDESWRQMRDFFYDPNMHGVDWKKMHDKYALLLPYVNHRNDLTYIIGELIGELNVGHAYAGGGERPKIKKIKTGLLGAKYKKDKNGYFQITDILKGENQNKSLRSPLTEPGMNIKKGDYIIAINGTETKNIDNINELLIGTAGKQIEITVNSKASKSGSRNLIVIPLADESKLYYYRMIQNNIKKVNEASNGQIGYIHVPDMGSNGYNKFSKFFYPQLLKKALIIDDRGNGGGNVSPIIIERLRRELAYFGTSRNVEIPRTGPRQMHFGPKVLLLNQYSASDGDLFPYQFKHYKIGKTIGVRSWGGVVGIRGSLPFVDGGSLHKPEFASYSADGKKWIIEGHGVEPDIVIENNPADEYTGKDKQLDKAIEILLEDIKNNKHEIKPVPKFPNKSK